jgi:hypothetical protein
MWRTINLQIEYSVCYVVGYWFSTDISVPNSPEHNR